MNIQQVIWDDAFMHEIQKDIHANYTEREEQELTAQDWLNALNRVCSKYWPDADDYELIFNTQPKKKKEKRHE